MRYETVLLDADDTLLDFHRSEREALSDMMNGMGVDPTEERLLAYSRINKALWKALERGEITKPRLIIRRFEEFMEYLSLPCDEERARSLAETYMNALSQKGYFLEGARELCEALYGKVRVYIVTNGVGFVQRGRQAISGLDRLVDGTFISEVIGYEKPSPLYFEHVAAEIPNFSKETTLIVGDSLSSDIRGGVDFGIDTCWYNPKGLLPSEELAGKITYTVKDHKEIEQIIREGAGK